jgi:DNA-binding transcriptional MocR family regulator
MNVSVLYHATATSAQGLLDEAERAIATGALGPGEQLPTVRSLAEALELSPTTVAAAYKELARRGLVVGEGRRGTFVRDAAPVSAPLTDAPLPPGVRDLRSGDADPARRPDLQPVLAGLRHLTDTYGGAATVPELAELAAGTYEADGIPVTRVAAVGGALDGIERVLVARLRPGDRVAVEDPGYFRVYDLLAALGLVPVAVPVDDDGITAAGLAAALDRGIDAVVVTPRAENPFGSALGGERAVELQALLAPHPHVLTVEDDHAGTIAGAPHVCLAAPGRERWAIVRSVSKSLGPDLRVAVLTGDLTTLDRVEGRQRMGTGWVSHLLQQIVAELWADAAVVASLADAADAYTARRRALVDALGTHGLAASARSGHNVWVPVPDEDAAVRGLLDAGYGVRAGARFRLATPPGIRITVARLDPSEAPDLAAALAAALRPAPTRMPST